MKTAVCIFGEIRGDEEQFLKVYNKVVLPNNADVFMYLTTYDNNFLDQFSLEQKEFLLAYYKNKSINYFPSNELLNIFKPKVIKCSQLNEYPLSDFNDIITKVNHVYSTTVKDNYNYDCIKLLYFKLMNQLETRASVIQLKQEYEIRIGFIYDNVILTRLDINPISEIKLDKKYNTIAARGGHGFINEQLLIGSSNLMNIFINLLKEMPMIHKEFCNIEHHYMQNEYHLFKFLEYHNIPLEFIDIPLKYHNDQEGPNGLKRFDKSFILSEE
jgi:hypothetical protein